MAKTINNISTLKKKFGVTDDSSDHVFENILQAQKQIQIAHEKMNEDCEVIHHNMITKENYKIPYGFHKNRFGELSEHPGNKIIKQYTDSIRSDLKMLGVKFDLKKEPLKKQKDPLSILREM